MTNLIGLHDREGMQITPPDSWIVDTVALSEHPGGMVYDPRFHWLARLNFGYGSTGTLPVVAGYSEFAERVGAYVAASRNCRRWIIGNEPNLSREWPAGLPIYPSAYAACFRLCRDRILGLAGHGTDEVLIAASGPWNAECTYAGNEQGDWIRYFEDQVDRLGGGFDGFALHAYTHGYDTQLVTSEAKMDPPFDRYHYEFRCYRDYLRAIPLQFQHLPCYISEANGNGEWQSVGLMEAMVEEISAWNGAGGQAVSSVCFFRYPDFGDGFAIEGKPDVVAEYVAAAAAGYRSPSVPAVPAVPEAPPDFFVSEIKEDAISDTKVVDDGGAVLAWDPLLDLRGVQHILGEALGGEYVWRVTAGDWFPPGKGAGEAQGRTNTFLAVVDEDGELAEGVAVRWFWPDGEEVKRTELKRDPWLGGQYSLDFPMYEGAPAYGFQIQGEASDIIQGLGLGSLAHPSSREHCAYYFALQRVRVALPVLPPLGSDKLIWPVIGPVTQWFGENPDRYIRFGEPGHNGIDIAVAVGTMVLAIADGEVMYIGYDKDYGYYVRVWHESIHSHSFYAHNSVLVVAAGGRVAQGQVLAYSGSTGFSTGPHCHLELRGGTRDSYHTITVGYGAGRYNPLAAYLVTGSALLPGG